MKSLLMSAVLLVANQAWALPMDLVSDLVNGKKSNVVSEALKGMTVTEIKELATQRCRGCYKAEINGTLDNGQTAQLVVQSSYNSNGGYIYKIESNTNDSKLGKDKNRVFGAVLTAGTENLIKSVAGVSNYELIQRQPSAERCLDCTLFHFSGNGRKAAVEFIVGGGVLHLSVRKIE